MTRIMYLLSKSVLHVFSLTKINNICFKLERSKHMFQIKVTPKKFNRAESGHTQGKAALASKPEHQEMWAGYLSPLCVS